MGITRPGYDNIAMVTRWPIEIDGLAVRHGGSFPWGTVSHNQMVTYFSPPMFGI